jgi:hypothetical protein
MIKERLSQDKLEAIQRISQEFTKNAHDPEHDVSPIEAIFTYASELIQTQ